MHQNHKRCHTAHCKKKQSQKHIVNCLDRYVLRLSIYILTIVLIFLFKELAYNQEKEIKDSNFNGFLFYSAYFCTFFLFWSFTKTAIVNPGYIPKNETLPDDLKLMRQQVIAKKACLKCKGILKIERSHHCSRCERCVLAMDHHCRFTGNCIGFYNRKYFVLSLFWGSMTLFNAVLFSLYNGPYVLKKAYHEWYSDMFLWSVFSRYVFLATLFSGTTFFWFVIACFCQLHIKYIINCITTIDTYKNIIKMKLYDQGKINNLKFYFGEEYWMWLLPIGKPTRGDGYTWQKPYELIQSDTSNTSIRIDKLQ